jgi:type I restriction enzyme S subunit
MSMETTVSTAHSSLQQRELPSGWRWVWLREVCEIIAGQSPPGSTYRASPEGLPFFQGKADFGLLSPVPRVWCVEPNKIALPGDILISVRAPVGPTNVADVKCCIGRGLAAIRCDGNTDSDFILSALRHFENKLIQQGSGSTFEAISRNDLEKLAIPLPPFVEQRRIAGALREQMAAVEKARTSAQARLEAVKALPAAFLRQIFPQPDQPLPDGWRWVNLGKVCERKTGIRDPRIEPDTVFQYVDITSVNNTQKCITKARPIIGKDAPSRARKVIRVNDVIVATTRPNLNAVAQVPLELDDQICSTGFCVLRSGMEILPDYLFAFVRHESFIEALTDLVKGALYPAVNDGHVMAQPIPLPPLVAQRRLAAALREQMTAVEKTRAAVEEELNTINAMPAALLRRAFNGEL